MANLKKRLSVQIVWGLFLLAGVEVSTAREIPVPLPEHPGNVCLEGERLSIALPPAFKEGLSWKLVDVDNRVVAQGVCGHSVKKLELGMLPLGWYRLEGLDPTGNVCAHTTAAIVRKLAVAVPDDSPIRIDTANAWFTRTGKPENDRAMMSRFGSLAALAGVSGVRDRLTWGEIETKPGIFQTQTRYDDSARILNGAGLQVLQVFHSIPEWARTPRLEADGGGGHYPRDLRDPYRFCKAMAERYRGKIQAWEPWNEANIPGFGGQISDEMCSLQKASYLGFKAGDPKLTVCWNVYAGSGTALHTQGVIDNAAWPYFDTYNIHSYSGVEQYVSEFATARQGACGKPLWISECGIHVQWNSEQGDLPDNEEIRQAQFVPKSYASSLFAGVSRHYFFILGNYCESKVQFGLLRHDLTPRRGYLALAATGRLLAGAQSLGRMTNGALRVYAFHACPDGAARDVLVAWADKGRAPTSFLHEVSVETAYDGYGRVLAGGLPKELGVGPVFAMLPLGESKKLKLDAPLSVLPAPRPAVCSPVVMQVIVPQAQTRLDLQAYQVEIGKENTVPVALYNLSDAPVSGTLTLGASPAGWRVTVPAERVCLRPLERLVLALKVTLPAEAGRVSLFGAPVTLRGNFGSAGEPVLSFRLACEPSAVKPAKVVSVASAVKAEAWSNNIVGGAKMTHVLKEGQMVFTLEFGDQDPWGYPRLKLAAEERPPAGADGIMAEVEVLEGEGTLRAQFIEAGGSTYLGELQYNFKKRGRQTVVAFFEKANWVSYSRRDADGKLTPMEMNGLMLGINAQRNSRVRLAIGNVRWVKF